MNDEQFATGILDAFDRHLREREATDAAVSEVAADSPQELWFSTEARIAIRKARGHGLPDVLNGERYWVALELKKVDLVIGCGPQDPPRCGAEFAFELKLILNNKNWAKAVDAVWTEVRLPRRTKLSARVPPSRRYGIAIEIFKRYEAGYGERFSIAHHSAAEFRRAVEGRLRETWQGLELRVLRSTEPIPLRHEWLEGDENALRLHLLVT